MQCSPEKRRPERYCNFSIEVSCVPCLRRLPVESIVAWIGVQRLHLRVFCITEIRSQVPTGIITFNLSRTWIFFSFCFALPLLLSFSFLLLQISALCRSRGDDITPVVPTTPGQAVLIFLKARATSSAAECYEERVVYDTVAREIMMSLGCHGVRDVVPEWLNCVAHYGGNFGLALWEYIWSQRCKVRFRPQWLHPSVDFITHVVSRLCFLQRNVRNSTIASWQDAVLSAASSDFSACDWREWSLRLTGSMQPLSFLKKVSISSRMEKIGDVNSILKGVSHVAYK